MGILTGVNPTDVFYYFEQISQIPRGSYHTKEISDFCVKFAKERNLEVSQDEWDNVIIKKQGTKGYEDSAPIIIQGHLDMVCEKTSDSNHDFFNDGLKLFVEDGYVKAKNTTLGADDGIAVAMALSLLDSRDIAHPPLEVLLTSDEEVGMLGAGKADLSELKGKILLNIDSEEEDTLTVGCAGGFRFTAKIPIYREEVFGVTAKIVIRGLKGGHSGTEIHRQRGNAHKLSGRLLNHLCKKYQVEICTIEGGSKDNVIAAENSMQVLLLPGDVKDVCAEISQMESVWREEFGQDEPDLKVECIIEEKGRYEVFSSETKRNVLLFLVQCPNGVYEFHRFLSDMVETSDNLGMVATNADTFEAVILVRSMLASKLEEMKEKFINLADAVKAVYTIEGEYPGWEYNVDSEICPLAEIVYEEIFGRKPKVQVIHAGLECGILCGNKPDLDCISYGPNILDIHSVKERLDIESTKKMWEFTKEILRRLK